MGYERDRGSARRRGYSARWDKASATFKQRHPWCLGCEAVGQRAATEIVDHVEPHKGDQAKFWDAKMWQPACGHCHNVIKPKLERMHAAGEIAAPELWLNSATAVTLSRKHPPRRGVGLDGW